MGKLEGFGRFADNLRKVSASTVAALAFNIPVRRPQINRASWTEGGIA
jgi:hypothetical protein